MRYFIPILAISLLISSCDYFKQGPNQVPIARVNDSYLYEDDLKDLITEGMSAQDSTIIVNNFINRWATQQLLIDQANINLPEETLENYNRLIQQYKTDLYTEAYKNVIVSRELDSVISTTEMESFYEANKQNFKLNDELVKVRYVHLDQSYSNKTSISDKIKNFDTDDKGDLAALSLQFISYNFNDSIWVKREALMEALPVLIDKSDQVLKKSNFTQLQDSLGVYLVKIEDVLRTNDIAPLSHIKPTIEQIILNKRKLELIKKLETDITKDAIKNNNFETYTSN